MSGGRGRRGQLVLLAAVALAAALVPLTLAYLQLGYVAEVGAGSDPVRETTAALERALEDATDGIPETYDWSARGAAVTEVRDRLAPDLEALERSRLDSGTATLLAYNASRATAWAGANCPGGPARQFGPCEADRGVVVQERADRTHVLAVALDVRVSAPDGDWRATVVVPVPGR